MNLTSRFLYESNPSLQLMDGMPSAKRLKNHVGANIIARKSGPKDSYVKLIADDIRKRSNDAVSGSNFGKEISNYYASHGLNPFKIAKALANDTGRIPSNADTEDVANDSGLNRALEKLEGYLAGTYGDGPGYHSKGSYNFGRPGGGGGGGGNGSSGGNGSGGNGSGGNGSSNGTGSSFSIPGVSSGNSMVWVLGGVGVLGALVLLKGRK